MLYNIDSSINANAEQLFLSICKELYTFNDNPMDLMWKVVERYENFTLANEQEKLLDFINDNWILIKEE
jgi:hypothetical protein